MKWSYLKLFKHLYQILNDYPLLWRKMAEFSDLDGGQEARSQAQPGAAYLAVVILQY